jgi:hypothetical protein
MRTPSRVWGVALLFFLFDVTASEPPTRKLIYRFTYEVQRGASSGFLFARIPLPVDEVGKQRIHLLNLDPRPTRILKGPRHHIAEWSAGNGPQPARFSVEIHAELFPPETESLQDISPQDIARYQQTEAYLETESSRLRQSAMSIPHHEDPLRQLAAIQEWVTTHLEYSGYDPEDRGALAAVERGKGDCSEFTDLFVALCRIKGFPARSRLCIQAESVDSPLHSIAEVYLQDQGWITVDPLWKDLHATRTDFPPHNRYLLLHLQRNEPELFGFFTGIAVKTLGGSLPRGKRTRLTISEQLPSGDIKHQSYRYGQELMKRDSLSP